MLLRFNVPADLDPEDYVAKLVEGVRDVTGDNTIEFDAAPAPKGWVKAVRGLKSLARTEE